MNPGPAYPELIVDLNEQLRQVEDQLYKLECNSFVKGIPMLEYRDPNTKELLLAKLLMEKADVLIHIATRVTLASQRVELYSNYLVAQEAHDG